MQFQITSLGADVILLIASVLVNMFKLANELRLEVFGEIHNENEYIEFDWSE